MPDSPMGQLGDRPRKDFADFAEPFCAGYIACRDGLSENPDEFMAALTDAWCNSGSERARRVVEAMQITNAALNAELERADETPSRGPSGDPDTS